MSDKPIVVDIPEGIRAFRLLALKGMLSLEVKGLKGRLSAYKQVKAEFGFKGSKASVLAQYEAHLRKIGVLV